MNGKEKCELLKTIRRMMAMANGIQYEPNICHFEGECEETCPLCEQEASLLLAELKKKENGGKEIVVPQEIKDMIERISGNEVHKNEILFPDFENKKHPPKGLWKRLKNWFGKSEKKEKGFMGYYFYEENEEGRLNRKMFLMGEVGRIKDAPEQD